MNKEYILVETQAQLDALYTILNSADFIVVDTETTGLNTRKDRVIGIALSAKIGTGYYVPLFKWNGVELEPLELSNKGSEIVSKLINKKLIFHNASYDIRIIRSNFNIDLLPYLYCDTIVLKHTVDEEFPFGLKEIASKLGSEIGLENVANQEQLDMIKSIEDNGGSTTKDNYELFKADYKLIGQYAAADADLTMRIFEYYSKELESQDLTAFFYKDEVMPLLREVTIPMESNGIPLNLNLILESKSEIEADLAMLEDQIQAEIKPYLGFIFEPWFLNKDFPPKRSGIFAQAVCEHASLPLPLTKAGNFSLAESELLKLPESKFKAFLLNSGATSENTYLDADTVLQIQKLLWSKLNQKYMFNLLSKHHLKKLFFDTLGEEALSWTDKGSDQMNEPFLESMVLKYPFVSKLLEYNKLSKIKSAYIDRFLEQQEDGLFYPRFMQHRTISGRYGSDLQQLPRPIEEGQDSELVIKHTNKIRKFFIAGEGYKFIDSDIVSLDPCVFAHVSGDDGLKQIFNSGLDFYSTIAIGAENLNGVSANPKDSNYLGKVNKPARQKAKIYCLGIPYGLESFKLSKDLNISQKEADKIIENYMKAFPKLHEWMLWSDKQCLEHGKIKSESGRIRHMETAKKIYYAHGPEILDSLKLWKKYNEHPKKYQQMKYLRKQLKNFLNNSKNFQIQSLAASIVNRAAIKINLEFKRLGLEAYVCAQIHDQLIIRVREDQAQKAAKITQYIMENNYKLSVPLKAPPQIANDFYEGH